METKTLYVFVQDCGDGSYSTRYTFDSKWVEKMEEKYENGNFDEYSMGCDGDGFHYDTLQVPVECTPESMGFCDCADDDEEE